MLQSIGSQRVGHSPVTEQQQQQCVWYSYSLYLHTVYIWFSHVFPLCISVFHPWLTYYIITGCLSLSVGSKSSESTETEVGFEEGTSLGIWARGDSFFKSSYYSLPILLLKRNTFQHEYAVSLPKFRLAEAHAAPTMGGEGWSGVTDRRCSLASFVQDVKSCEKCC